MVAGKPKWKSWFTRQNDGIMSRLRARLTLTTKSIDQGQQNDDEYIRKTQTEKRLGPDWRLTTGCWRRIAPDRCWRAPRAHYQPGPRDLRQSKLAQVESARSYAAGGFHPARKNHPFRSRAYSRTYLTRDLNG